MALKLNGTTGYLVMEDAVSKVFPYSMIGWFSTDGGTGANNWITQGDSALQRYLTLIRSFGSKLAQHYDAAGSGSGATKSTAPDPSASLQLAVAVFTSPTSRKVYFGSSTPSTVDTAARSNTLSTHNRFIVGATQVNGATSASGFLNGQAAEVHVFNVALTDTDVANLIAATVKPEDISGYVDGWALKDYEASGNYISIGGTRTLVAMGGVTQGAATHPVSRVTPNYLGSASASAIAAATASLTTSIRLSASALGVATAIASLADNGLSSVAVSIASASASLTTAIRMVANGVSVATATAALTTNPAVRFFTPPMTNNNATPLASETGVVVNIYNVSTGALVLRQTGLVSDSSGIIEIVSSSLVSGTTYAYEVVLTANGRRLPTALAT